VAIKVSGGHPVPVIVRASGRGRRAPRFRGPGHRQVSRPLRRRCPAVLIIDDLHELISGYGENAWAGGRAHLDAATERGRAHHREIHRVLAAADIEVFTTTTTTTSPCNRCALTAGPAGRSTPHGRGPPELFHSEGTRSGQLGQHVAKRPGAGSCGPAARFASSSGVTLGVPVLVRLDGVRPGGNVPVWSLPTGRLRRRSRRRCRWRAGPARCGPDL